MMAALIYIVLEVCCYMGLTELQLEGEQSGLSTKSSVIKKSHNISSETDRTKDS